MFNIYINDILFFLDSICFSNYADDTTLYSIRENQNTTRNIKKKFFYPYRKWFYDNSMVLNPGKCSYTSFDYNPDKTDSTLEDSSKIPSAEEYVVLGVTLDNRLTVYNQLNP